jgi:hypothetical protein
MNIKRLSIIFLGLSWLIPAGTTKAIPLSPQSKKFVAVATLVGAGIGSVIGGISYANDRQELPQGFWAKCKDLAGFVLLPAAIGAAIVGGGSYFFTGEQYFLTGQNEFNTVLANGAFNTLSDTDNLEKAKELYPRESFPSIALTNKLNNLYDLLDSAKANLVTAMNSGIASISAAAVGLIAAINGQQKRIGDWLTRLKPEYQHELGAQAQLSIAESQRRRAQAQRDMAAASWYRAFFYPPSRRVVVVPARPVNRVVVHAKQPDITVFRRR